VVTVDGREVDRYDQSAISTLPPVNSNAVFGEHCIDQIGVSCFPYAIFFSLVI